MGYQYTFWLDFQDFISFLHVDKVLTQEQHWSSIDTLYMTPTKDRGKQGEVT